MQRQPSGGRERSQKDRRDKVERTDGVVTLLIEDGEGSDAQIDNLAECNSPERMERYVREIWGTWTKHPGRIKPRSRSPERNEKGGGGERKKKENGGEVMGRGVEVGGGEVKSRENPRSTQSDRKGQLEAPGKFSPSPPGHAKRQLVTTPKAGLIMCLEECQERKN